PLDMADHPFAVRTVLQENLQLDLRFAERGGLVELVLAFGILLVRAGPVAEDEALIHEDFCNGDLYLGGLHFDEWPFHGIRVADASEHIRDGISHHVRCPPFYHEAFWTPGIRPLEAI